MVTILELKLPTEEFALNKTLTTVSAAHIKIERVVADDPNRLTPYVWVRTDDFDAFEAALNDDPTVKDVTELAETDEERSYQMTWIDSIDLILRLLTEHEGTVTHAEGSADGWHLRIVFPDYESLSQAHDAIKEDGFQFEVRAVYDVDDPRHTHYGLTETQRNTMVAALEAGYFDVPRKMTLTEFAEQQGISHQAISEQLRRATRQLTESTLTAHGDEEEE